MHRLSNVPFSQPPPRAGRGSPKWPIPQTPPDHFPVFSVSPSETTLHSLFSACSCSCLRPACIAAPGRIWTDGTNSIHGAREAVGGASFGTLTAAAHDRRRCSGPAGYPRKIPPAVDRQRYGVHDAQVPQFRPAEQRGERPRPDVRRSRERPKGTQVDRKARWLVQARPRNTAGARLDYRTRCRPHHWAQRQVCLRSDHSRETHN